MKIKKCQSKKNYQIFNNHKIISFCFILLSTALSTISRAQTLGISGEMSNNLYQGISASQVQTQLGLSSLDGQNGQSNQQNGLTQFSLYQKPMLDTSNIPITPTFSNQPKTITAIWSNNLGTWQSEGGAPGCLLQSSLNNLKTDSCK